MTKRDPSAAEPLPRTYRAFIARFPEIGEAHDTIAGAIERARPLTCGFSRAAMAWQWSHHQIERGTSKPPDHE